MGSLAPGDTIIDEAAAQSTDGTPFSLPETINAAVVALAVVVAFIFIPWPRELIALTAAGVLLISRRVSSTDMLKQVDGDLILLIMGLFVVNAAISNTGLPQTLLSHLAHAGIDLQQPFILLQVDVRLGNHPGSLYGRNGARWAWQESTPFSDLRTCEILPGAAVDYVSLCA